MTPVAATRSDILCLFGQGKATKKPGNFKTLFSYLLASNCNAVVLLVYLGHTTYSQTFFVQLEQLIIGHDNKGEDPAWYLDEVDVDIPVRDEHYKFRCGGWLGGDRPGQRKEAVLFPGILSMHLTIFPLDEF